MQLEERHVHNASTLASTNLSRNGMRDPSRNLLRVLHSKAQDEVISKDDNILHACHAFLLWQIFARQLLRKLRNFSLSKARRWT